MNTVGLLLPMNVSMGKEAIREMTKRDVANLMVLKEKRIKGIKKAVKFREDTLIFSIYDRKGALLDMYIWTSDFDYLECNFDQLVELYTRHAPQAYLYLSLPSRWIIEGELALNKATQHEVHKHTASKKLKCHEV